MRPGLLSLLLILATAATVGSLQPHRRPSLGARRPASRAPFRCSASAGEQSTGWGEGDFGYTAVMLVPTGIGASIGGYAGDAMPTARAVASVVDTLVTHPNVMNGAQMYWPESNILYTEGYALDEWAAGRWGLTPKRFGGHRIGLLLDAGIEDDLRLRHLQAAEAARATLGIDVSHVVTTDQEIGVELAMSPFGASWGTLRNPDSLIRAARRLVEEAGCSAIAVVARFPEDEDEDMLEAYRQGDGVDAVGGAEAIISHLVTQDLRVPCAHAPALSPLDASADVSPSAAAEELGYTFLPCVLTNLHRAPSLVQSSGISGVPIPGGAEQGLGRGSLWAGDVHAVVAPLSACGGSAVLNLASRPVLLILVEDNDTEMKATPDILGMDTGSAKCEIVRVRSYLEAIGVLVAHKAGILRPALTGSVGRLEHLPPVSVPTNNDAENIYDEYPTVPLAHGMDEGQTKEQSALGGTGGALESRLEQLEGMLGGQEERMSAILQNLQEINKAKEGPLPPPQQKSK